MNMKAFGVLAALLLAGSIAWADVESGPKAGERVPALKAFGVVGSVEGKEADFAADRKDAPTIYIFVKAEEAGLPVGGRPAAKFMKVLDTEVGKLDGVAIVAVWLGDKSFDKHREYLPKFQMSLRLEKTSLAAFDGERTGPNNWGGQRRRSSHGGDREQGEGREVLRLRVGERDRCESGGRGTEEADEVSRGSGGTSPSSRKARPTLQTECYFPTAYSALSVRMNSRP
ncbi:MAG: hypothetical protein U0792_03195 [Gemmataceae bacterium]